MIIRAGAVEAQQVQGSMPRREAKLGLAGGLKAFGANVVTLQPGEQSSDRHWHTHSDEFLYVLEGAPTVVEEDSAIELSPGDCCCWPAGVPNGHTVLNRSDAPVIYLVVGSKPGVDTVRYPDSNRTLHHQPPRWWIVTDDGRLLAEGSTEDD
jgi:uncharacterized cupin superfamily protein